MFCGRPAVVTRTGGNHELLRDNKDGFVSAGGDPEIIREALEPSLDEPREMAGNGRSRFPESQRVDTARFIDSFVSDDL
jgi:glycosyltransferase involved in cell wall biosynthesis